MDTAIGGGIVLIFGYFIWPRSHAKQLASSYQTAMGTLANYFRAACLADQTNILSTRYTVYSQLSNLRIQLQTQLSEPSPSDREALEWFPIIAGTERLTDCITIYAEHWAEGAHLPSQDKVEELALYMESMLGQPHPLNEATHYSESKPEEAFLDEVISDLGAISRLIHSSKQTL